MAWICLEITYSIWKLHAWNQFVLCFGGSTLQKKAEIPIKTRVINGFQVKIPNQLPQQSDFPLGFFFFASFNRFITPYVFLRRTKGNRLSVCPELTELLKWKLPHLMSCHDVMKSHRIHGTGIFLVRLYLRIFIYQHVMVDFLMVFMYHRPMDRMGDARCFLILGPSIRLAIDPGYFWLRYPVVRIQDYLKI